MMESLSTRRETGSRSIQEPPMMSSSSGPMTERLLCSICLEVFSDPVSTPCGHNFCKICLKINWNNSQDYRCPNCQETFNQRPDLKINTTLRDVVDEHKKKSQKTQAEAEVVCDFCTEGKLKAVKSCLVCQISYCETHLESHLRVSGLQKHKLIDPVKNLQDYICQKHDRPLELFCRDDHTCVCLSCTDGDHKNHNTVPLKESELKEMMKEKQRAAERQNEDVILDLKEEITELKKKNTELEMVKQKQITEERRYEDVIKDLKEEITEQQQKISNTEDHLRLIQKKHQKDLSRQQKSSSEDLCSRIVGVVLLVLFIIASVRLEMVQKEFTELQMRSSDLETDMLHCNAGRLEFTELQMRYSELETEMLRCKADCRFDSFWGCVTRTYSTWIRSPVHPADKA
ncbi:Tripartite motif-containing protein 47 [Triplophysa tibetana]|uniref:Tripartite motif-containing protein 47 n=1 Tax=Triplophysa tibetana TaxID=1572043 RepID=A0A5A9NKN9_9TELE|nr:Tripartite motif-containing protein 47 [Triplophysa tibetana]